VIAAVIAALLAGPATAQAIPFAPEATEGCLVAATAAAAGLDGQKACVGQSADACIDTPDGYTTVGMGFCFGAERDWWDARLNAAYGALMDMEKAAEAELKELGSAAPSPAVALRDMQRVWIAWRDAACDYEVSQWGGGTGGGPAWSQCTMQMTGEQALALEERLAQRRAQ
jgi:uncharacterized protein YecT (DUF1311 family)